MNDRLDLPPGHFRRLQEDRGLQSLHRAAREVLVTRIENTDMRQPESLEAVLEDVRSLQAHARIRKALSKAATADEYVANAGGRERRMEAPA